MSDAVESSRNEQRIVRDGPPDADVDAMLERNLRLTPAQRLANAAPVARFVILGREKLRSARGG